MADFANTCVRPDMDKNKTRLPISSEKPADVTSPDAMSSIVPEAAKNDDEIFNKIDHSHREVLEKSWKLISCGNRSSENTSIEQEISRYQTCNRMTALQGDKNDAGCVRSNNRSMNSRCDMHEDLLFGIMLWLPVASLLRFRSACRLWRSLIDSSTFVTQHYNHNSNKSCLLAHHKVLSYDADDNSNFFLLSGNKYEVYSNLDYQQPWYSVDEITILNSCNGIVSLLSEECGNEKVALWNPATKQLRPLPESSISHQYPMDVEFGFGFDAKSNDYKVVKILYHKRNKHNNLVEVYNLRTDSWRTIHKDDVLPFRSVDRSGGTIFNNGTCFWTGYNDPDESSPILIYFDLNYEVFEAMLLPGEHGPDHCIPSFTALAPLNDNLCCIKGIHLDISYGYITYFEIWILGEYGVKESWKKICTLKPNGSLVVDPPYVLGFSKNGEFLLLGYKYEYGELYLSNFDAREEGYLELQGPKRLPNPDIWLEFVCYNESLVSLKREDGGAHK